MEENTILLNRGHDYEVAVLPDAYPMLVRILGGEPDRQEILTLRSSHDGERRERVAVFAETELVGYLPVDVNPGLLATVKACELNEAVACAQSRLVASWEEPGKVIVRVDLADPEHLLSAPEPVPEEPTGGEDLMSTATSSGLESAEAPALSAGYAEDYPDWPLRKPKPSVTDQAPLTVEPPLASMSSMDEERLSTVEPPAGQTSSPSPSALLATRSAWAGGAAGPAQAPQAGWLGSKAGTGPQSSSQSAAPSPPGAHSSKLGTPSEEAPASTAPLGSSKPAQSQVDPARARPNDLDSEIVAAWGSSSPTPQPLPELPPTSKRPSNTKWVLPTVAAVLVIVIGLLVWKFVFAPKTYTDPDYGYSFQYPGRWEVFADSSMLSQFAYMLEGEAMPSMVMVGDGLDSNNIDDVAMLAVARADVPGYVDRSQIAAEMQSQFDQASISGIGFTLLEPVYPTTIGGLEGWKTTMSVGIGFYSMTVSYCFLLDGNTMYVLMAAATGEAWDNNRKTFERFFDSFEPG